MVERRGDMVIEFSEIIGGGVTSPRGFRASGIHAGFKDGDLLDLAVIISDNPCSAAAVFTQNIFCAAPVMLSRRQLGEQSQGSCQAIVINSGNANAATGDPGISTAEATIELASEIIGCSAKEVLVASTGVIGVPLGLDTIRKGLPEVIERASASGGHFAAEAIMTTDTHPKEYAISYQSNDPEYLGTEFRIGGMAKGSGMIMPDMATLIVVISTDAPLEPELAHRALRDAVALSFNKVSIDSDTSTNDSCFLLAGGGEAAPFKPQSQAFQEFQAALNEVCITLARQIAADGEGATKLITVAVRGAANEGDADKAARAIVNSPLVKTAVFGHDANWGRIAMALGKSGARFRQEDVSIDLLGLAVLREGLPVVFDEEEALRRFEQTEIEISVDLKAGPAETTMWTCDYSYDYIKINGEYRT